MKKQVLKIVLGLFVVGLVAYSCTKDQFNISEQQEENRLITYDDGQPIPGQYIVVYKETALPGLSRSVTPENYLQSKQLVSAKSDQLLKEYGIRDKTILQSYAKTIHGFAVQLSEEELNLLQRDDRIAYIEQDQLVSVSMGGPPGNGGGGGGGGNPSQQTPWGITRVGGPVAGSSGTAWVLDTGIDLDHPDLNVDASRGYNAFDRGKDGQSLDDGNGHGSHVAGTIAAIDNEIGVVGVAAGATVVPVKVLDQRGSGSYSGVIAGVDHVGANGSNGDVANMSLTGPGSLALDNAVKSAASNGVRFCLAAGNNSSNANNYSPARVNGQNIYTVSSMTSSDSWSYFSNYGNPPVDYCAPGSSILSCYKDGGYATLSGTSMATPHVAGILLAGNLQTDGTVNGDPDGNPDPIAHL